MSDKLREAFEQAFPLSKHPSREAVAIHGIHWAAYCAGYAYAMRESASDQQAEPVAWRIQRNDGAYELYLHKPSAERAADCYIVRPKVEPLYTSPPKSEPMTDEEMIRRGWRRCAVGQRSSQYCGLVQEAVAKEREAFMVVINTVYSASPIPDAMLEARGQK